MVAFKYLFLTAAAIFGVLAQDVEPTGSDAEAEAYWAGEDGADGAPAEKRSEVFAHMPRNNPPPVIKDPYKGFHCKAKYTLPPCATTCNRNNCFRAFISAKGNSKHCPIEAFGFCCKWNKANPWEKWWAVKTGKVYWYAPYAKNCQGNGDQTKDVVAKINDVCGCTLNHEVTLDISQNPEYWALRWYWYGNPKCH